MSDLSSLQSSCLDKICQYSLPTSSLPPLLAQAVSNHKRNKVFAGNFQYVRCGLENGSSHDVTEATVTIQQGDKEGVWLFTFRSHLFSAARCFFCDPVPTPALQQFRVVEGEPVPFFSPFVECEQRLHSVFPGIMMRMNVELNFDMTGVLRWRGGDERGEFSSSWYISPEVGGRKLVHRAGYTTRGWERIKNFTVVAIETQVEAEKAYSDNERMNEENQRTLRLFSFNGCGIAVDDSTFDMEDSDSESIE